MIALFQRVNHASIKVRWSIGSKYRARIARVCGVGNLPQSTLTAVPHQHKLPSKLAHSLKNSNTKLMPKPNAFYMTAANRC